MTFDHRRLLQDKIMPLSLNKELPVDKRAMSPPLNREPQEIGATFPPHQTGVSLLQDGAMPPPLD